MKVKLDEGAFAPERAHDTDAGFDLRTPYRKTLIPNGCSVIDTGIHVELPPGTCGLIVSKSGLNVKDSITSTGLIDEGYTGSIKVKLYNNSAKYKNFKRGDKISQLVIVPCVYEPVDVVEELTETDRGDDGFGSTGR